MSWHATWFSSIGTTLPGPCSSAFAGSTASAPETSAPFVVTIRSATSAPGQRVVYACARNRTL